MGMFRLGLCVLAALIACSKKSSDLRDGNGAIAKPHYSSASAPIPLPDVALSPLSLVGSALVARIDVPSGAVSRQRFHSTQVSTPSGEFAVVIQPARGSLTERKQVIADNPHNRLVEYLVEQEHSILYESQLDGEPEFHLLVQRTVHGTRYDCQDRKGRRFSLPEAHTMLLACRSLVAQAPTEGAAP